MRARGVTTSCGRVWISRVSVLIPYCDWSPVRACRSACPCRCYDMVLPQRTDLNLPGSSRRSAALKILQGLKRTAEKDALYGLAAHHRLKGAGARGKRQQSEAAKTFAVPNFRGHELRRTAASIMASGGISRLTISKILNHVERTVTAVYDRHSYDAEKAAALRWWNAKLTSILAVRKSSVRPFTKAPSSRRATSGLRRVV